MLVHSSWWAHWIPLLLLLLCAVPQATYHQERDIQQAPPLMKSTTPIGHPACSGGSAAVRQPHAQWCRQRRHHTLNSHAPSAHIATATALRDMQGPTAGPETAAVAAAPAHSHADSAPRQRRSAIVPQPLRSDEVWYLAYGSNLSPFTLTSRRRVRPQQSVPCYVPGHALSFGVQGFPWAEPGFATIQRSSCDAAQPAGLPGSCSSSWRQHRFADGVPCLHGVLHRVTLREWALIKASEGVMGGDNSSVGYQVVEVDCVLYDDTTVIRAATLQAAPASLHQAGRDVQPSARYLRLLQAGSRHHGLDQHYQQWLDSLQPYKPPSTVQAAVGSLASGAVLLSAAYTAVPAYVISRATSSSSNRAEPQAQAAADASSSSSSGEGEGAGASSRAPPEGFLPFLRWYTGSSQRLVWTVHDSLAPWLGSGSSMDK